MASITDNKAAWEKAAFDKHFVVEAGPDQTKPEDDEVVIQAAYVAINPSEWKFQEWAYIPVEYPHVLGSDVAGEVVLTGKSVTKFKPGDRVIGHCLGLVHGGAKHGSFQLFTTCKQAVVARVPDSLHLAKAVVLPLALSTAITGLFEMLKLRLPSMDSKPSTESVLIWGGSSSVGSAAIQLARAAGYQVITTASKHNHEFMKQLGTAEVFDQSDPDVLQTIRKRLEGTEFAGALDCIGEERTTRACADIVAHFGGGLLPTVLWPPKDLPETIKAELVFATNPGTVENYVAASVWAEFVPAALASGQLQPKPDPMILLGGLESIQDGVNVNKRGVSAKKVVVKIDDSAVL